MTRKIPKGTTLTIALECLKADKVRSPALIDEFAKIAAEYKGRDRVLTNHEERQRIARQRALFEEVDEQAPSPAVNALKEAIIERAWALLDMGESAACDALLEFVPEADATKMLDEFFKEDMEPSHAR